jgi:hypothetical protein
VHLFPILLIAVTAAADAEFEIRTLDGQSASGSLVSIDAEKIVTNTSDGPRTFPFAELAAVGRQPAPAVSPRGATLWVELADDTALAATEYLVKSGTATIRLVGGESCDVPAAAVRSVRFGPPERYDPKLTKQWTELAGGKPAGDLVVVRRDEALDYLEGVLRDVDADTCHFELDGEVIAVKRAKVEGLVYAHPKERELPAAVGKLALVDGSRLLIHKLNLADGKLSVSTPLGAAVEMPLDQVARFDFSSGKLAYLSDLEPDAVEFTPFIRFQQPPAGLLEFYRYRRDVGFENTPLRMDGKVHKKGLALASRTTLVYKLTDDYRLFRATAGIDDSTRETGSVRLAIKGDGKVLWESEVRGTEPPHKLELPVDGVKRLEILVDYGENLDVGDWLDLGDAHVTK